MTHPTHTKDTSFHRFRPSAARRCSTSGKSKGRPARSRTTWGQEAQIQGVFQQNSARHPCTCPAILGFTGSVPFMICLKKGVGRPEVLVQAALAPPIRTQNVFQNGENLRELFYMIYNVQLIRVCNNCNNNCNNNGFRWRFLLPNPGSNHPPIPSITMPRPPRKASRARVSYQAGHAAARWLPTGCAPRRWL